MKIKLTFRSVEYISFIREVAEEEIDAMDTGPGDLFDALHAKFADDRASDSEISNEEYGLDEYEFVNEEKEAA